MRGRGAVGWLRLRRRSPLRDFLPSREGTDIEPVAGGGRFIGDNAKVREGTEPFEQLLVRQGVERRLVHVRDGPQTNRPVLTSRGDPVAVGGDGGPRYFETMAEEKVRLFAGHRSDPYDPVEIPRHRDRAGRVHGDGGHAVSMG